MKTINQLLFSASLLLIPATSPAQKAVGGLEAAFGEAVSAIAPHTTSVSTGNDNGSAYKICHFAYKGGADRALVKFGDALTAASASAYRSLMKRAGSEDAATLCVAYGAGARDTVVFGGDKSHGYRVVWLADSADATMRYVFALETYQQGRKSLGRLYRIHGKAPQSPSYAPMCPSAYPHTGDGKQAGGMTAAASGGGTVSSQAQTVVNPKGGKSQTVTYADDGTLTVNGKREGCPDEYIKSDRTPKSSADFLELFTTLYTIFIANAENFDGLQNAKGSTPSVEAQAGLNRCAALISGAASRIYRLCKEQGKLLDKTDRQMANALLNQMREKCRGGLETYDPILLNAQNVLLK